MKNGRLQCKDIPDEPVLHFLASLNEAAGWHTFPPNQGFQPTVLDAMPSGLPWRLVLAKMRMLIRRGLVDGCGCGCRGDFELTGKGQLMVNQTESK